MATFLIRLQACGVFSDKVRQMADPAVKPIMIAGPGTHIILPDYASPAQMGLVWFTRDGRVRQLRHHFGLLHPTRAV